MIDQIVLGADAEQPPLLLSADDHDRLISLARDTVDRYPAEDARLLLDELQRADIVPPDWMPEEVVAMNSYVEFDDDRTGVTRRVQLVFPYRADISKGRISVLSLIGAALIGLAEGQSIVWQTRDKRPRRLSVRRVSRAPFPTPPRPNAQREGEAS